MAANRAAILRAGERHAGNLDPARFHVFRCLCIRQWI